MLAQTVALLLTGAARLLERAVGGAPFSMGGADQRQLFIQAELWRIKDFLFLTLQD
jgi:hypothetical protein